MHDGSDHPVRSTHLKMAIHLAGNFQEQHAMPKTIPMKAAGLSRESLYRAQSADGNPNFATVLKVAKALGVRLHAEAA